MTIEKDTEELAGLANKHPEIAELLKAIVAVVRKLDTNTGTGIAGIVEAHQAPAVIHRETPEGEEWRRQTDLFISKGFHEVLKLDLEQYRLTIPQFNPNLTSDGYDRFLAVDPRIALPELHRLLGITEYIDTANVINLVGIPRKPYVVCLQSGPVELYMGTFEQAMARIPRKGVAISFVEVDMAYLRYPELFQPWIDAGSSRYGADLVPCLLVDGGRPGVGADWVDYPSGRWQLLSRGKKLGT